MSFSECLMVKQIPASPKKKKMSQPVVGPSLPEKKPCIFYKLMVASILQDKKLRIPYKFVKKFGDELSAIATLTVPSGPHWLVHLRKDKKRMWFDSGWNVFVEYYSIGIGCLLVFRYEGNSCFNVHVYDLKTSEINYLSYSVNNSQEPGDDKHVNDGDFSEIMDYQPTCSSPYSLIEKDFDEFLDHDRKKYKNSTCGSGTDLKNLHQKSNGHDLQAKFQSTRGKGVQFSGVEFTSTADGGPDFLNETQENAKKLNQGTQLNMNEHESLGKVEADEELIRAISSRRNVPRRQREVTREEKQNALRAAAMFKPNNPFCRIVLRPSYVYKGILLHIPRCFARRYLNGVDGTISLQLSEGKKWPVRCVYAHGSLKFSKGWAEFVLDNSLDEGDVCVFELIKSMEIVLKVTIFRVLADAVQK